MLVYILRARYLKLSDQTLLHNPLSTVRDSLAGIDTAFFAVNARFPPDLYSCARQMKSDPVWRLDSSSVLSRKAKSHPTVGDETETHHGMSSIKFDEKNKLSYHCGFGHDTHDVKADHNDNGHKRIEMDWNLACQTIRFKNNNNNNNNLIGWYILEPLVQAEIPIRHGYLLSIDSRPMLVKGSSRKVFYDFVCKDRYYRVKYRHPRWEK